MVLSHLRPWPLSTLLQVPYRLIHDDKDPALAWFPRAAVPCPHSSVERERAMKGAVVRAFDKPRIENRPAPAPTRTAHLEELTRDECIVRLESTGVGRVAAVLDSRPYISPVNYVVHEDAVIFRTRSGSRVHMATLDSYAALEIDSVDFMYHEGWSVLVQGRSSHVIDPDEVITLAQVCVAPWVDDARDSFVRIRFDEVRGERISHRLTAPPPPAGPNSSEEARRGGV